jgi:acetyltransferase-like isoleucine patch superfamily enzyme
MRTVERGISSAYRMPLRLGETLRGHMTKQIVASPTASLRIRGKVTGGGILSVRSRARVWIERGGVLSIDGQCVLFSGSLIHVRAGETVSLGSNVSIQEGGMILGDIAIGRDSLLAPRVFLSSGTHLFDRDTSLTIREQEARYGVASEPISVGRNCWLGIGSVVMPGVTLGDSVVVGANSVVTRDFGAQQVLGGVPARVLRSMSPPTINDPSGRLSGEPPEGDSSAL